MLTTPLIINTPLDGFDAKDEQKIKFQVIGGEQIYGSEIEVQDNITRDTIFQARVDSFVQEGVIPSNALINGKEYRVRIKTYNLNQVNSEWSDWEIFYCFSEPTFVINNVSNILEYNNYTFEGKYFQKENEELESYQFLLYDEYDYPIQVSDVRYDKGFTFDVKGLIDGDKYSIEMKGETVHRMKITTGKIPFQVEVIKPSTALAFNVENIKSEGQIKITSNILQVEGESVNGALNYIQDSYVDLRRKDDIVRFQKGFTVRGNFTLKIWIRNPVEHVNLVEIYERGHTIKDRRLIEMVYRNNRIEVRKRYGNLSPYYIESDFIPTSNGDIMVFLHSKDDRLKIEVAKVGDNI